MQYRFGDYLLDVARRELRLGGEPISIEPQVFDLLAYLIQNRDRVVTKDDLLGYCVGWSDRFRIDADQPDQCGAPGDRRYGINTKVHSDIGPQGDPLRGGRGGCAGG